MRASFALELVAIAPHPSEISHRAIADCTPHKHQAASREKYFGFRNSLREYAALLYRRHPPGFALFVRGKRVPPRDLRKDLKHVKVEGYTPAGEQGAQAAALERCGRSGCQIVTCSPVPCSV